MTRLITTSFFCLISLYIYAQDLSSGYIANDLAEHPMQDLDKPAYLDTVNDMSFPGTSIRRISEANENSFMVPMYSTIQSWNADESRMILYGNGDHQLLDGVDYTFIRTLDDINPDDIEAVFWDFNDPDILFYIDNNTSEFISYNVSTQVNEIIADLASLSGCTEGITGGNDIQMMSWDSDVISFRCGNTNAYYYRISTETLTEFTIDDIAFNAPMPFPSGNLFYHQGNIYNAAGLLERSLNLNTVHEHSCLGVLSNGDDAYFAIAFEEGPNSGCQGTLTAHNATDGNCFSVASATDYGYPQSGTHISALAHKNTEGGWVAVSCIGFDKDGQDLLDQEIFIAKVNENDADVYRVAHHRSDEDDIDYWGEPHVTISPSGTRLLFGSDWSGSDDGVSVDSYVAELPAYLLGNQDVAFSQQIFSLASNPVKNELSILTENINTVYTIVNILGKTVINGVLENDQQLIDVSTLNTGVYFIKLNTRDSATTLRFLKK